MPYDKESFLAGVAVGRNLMGWPEMDGYGKNFFAFTIRVDSASFYYQFGIYFSGIVYWGDGTTEEPTPRYGRIYHTYADPGVYQIRIIGHFQSIMLGTSDGSTPATPSASAARLISVDTPYPQLTLQDGSYVSSVSLNWLFSYCSNLEQIPKNLFDNLKKQGVTITGLQGMFRQCIRLSKLPQKLYSGLVFAETFTNETSPARLFSGCSSLQRLPADIFDNPGFERVKSVAFMFSGSGLVEFPVEELPFLSAVNFELFCSGCVSLESVPIQLFSRCVNASSFMQSFHGCSGIISAVPELWVQYPDAGHSLCFTGCVNALNYNSIPQAWGGPST